MKNKMTKSPRYCWRSPVYHGIAVKARQFFCAIAAALLLTACVGDDEYDNDPAGNFAALWEIIDQHYCFFAEKAEQYGLDWDEIHDKYAQRIDAQMTDTQLFEVLGDMLSELRDGHVNLYSAWDVARNWSWHEDYPSNLSDTLITKYLGTDYRIATGMRYRILDDNIGYIRLASFENSMGDGNLTEVFSYLLLCDGIIIDIRDNSGGLLTSAEELAARFTDEETLVGYMKHKTGTGHSDFSSLEEQLIQPSKGLRWHKPVAVLTNRQVFSAANEFVKYMRCMPDVITVGDTTGGGAGLPFSDELPNGWSVRFSACPMYDRDGNPTEFGIEPDYAVSLSQSDLQRGQDTIIEKARQLIRDMR